MGMTGRQRLDSKIDKYLATYKKAMAGGWPGVEQSEIAQLEVIVRALIDLKYERDSDNDSPVEFCVVDRTKHERPYYAEVPYTHESSIEKRMEGAQACISVARHYSERADQIIDLLRRDLAIKEVKPLTPAQQRALIVEGLLPKQREK